MPHSRCSLAKAIPVLYWVAAGRLPATKIICVHLRASAAPLNSSHKRPANHEIQSTHDETGEADTMRIPEYLSASSTMPFRRGSTAQHTGANFGV